MLLFVDPLFFTAPNDLRKWLRQNHTKADELWVGYYRKGSGKPSITWPESVDEALCVGWIDGIRKRIDHESYKVRFTARRRGSIWSSINIRRAEALTNDGRMRPQGLKAFAARRENKSGIYSYEQRRAELEEPYQSLLRKNKAAWEFFAAQPSSYRKMIAWWILSAKREEARQRRLQKLIEASADGKRL